MDHLSLFNGIGGFQLAAKWAGWNNIAHVEIDDFCNKVVAYHFPESECYTDIKKFDGKKFKNRVDVVSGGFPCQPFSHAGKRKGTEDDRNLWPEMFRVIRECSPVYVVAENVYGLTTWSRGMVFKSVLSDLESAGYEILSILLPASGKNAPHRRVRLFIVAYSRHAESQRREFIEKGQQSGRGGQARDLPSPPIEPRSTSNPVVSGNGEQMRDQREGQESDLRGEGHKEHEPGQDSGSASNPIGIGHGGCAQASGCDGISTTQWEHFPTQSPVCGGNDGLPDELDGITFSKWRKETLKAYGNAIVPQIVYQIFKVINKLRENEQI